MTRARDDDPMRIRLPPLLPQNPRTSPLQSGHPGCTKVHAREIGRSGRGVLRERRLSPANRSRQQTITARRPSVAASLEQEESASIWSAIGTHARGSDFVRRTPAHVPRGKCPVARPAAPRGVKGQGQTQSITQPRARALLQHTPSSSFLRFNKYARQWHPGGGASEQEIV